MDGFSRMWVVPVVIGMAFCAHASGPASAVDNIADAQWHDHQDMYPVSALCEAEEITLWTCEGNGKTYSLCSSREVTADAGYLQYRAGNAEGATFQFPGDRRHPRGIFTQRNGPSGDAFVTFRNGGYRYTLIDRLRGTSSILVSSEAGETSGTEIACRNSNQSLQLNYTLRMMRLSGVEER